MSSYRERLWPSVPIFLATALVIPACILVLAPVSMLAGIISAAVLFVGFVAVLAGTAPVITVQNGVFSAGKATIPLSMLGTPESFLRGAASLERGRRLDARAWLCLRGWVDPVVKIPLHDPEDPTPYWLISTRRPEALKAALAGNSGALSEG